MIIITQELGIIELNMDFYLEIYPDLFDKHTTEIWLCRKNYGLKCFLLGIPKGSFSLEDIEEYYQDSENWCLAAQELLDENERLDEYCDIFIIE